MDFFLSFVGFSAMSFNSESRYEWKKREYQTQKYAERQVHNANTHQTKKMKKNDAKQMMKKRNEREGTPRKATNQINSSSNTDQSCGNMNSKFINIW